MEARELYEIFPDYSLHPSFAPDDDLKATLQTCYEPKAIKLRMMFLLRAHMLSKEIADDLFTRAWSAFEVHLRNCTSYDLSEFGPVYFSYRDSLPRLGALFQPRDRFTPEAWETMKALLSAVWEWARQWRLGHYTYVRFACHALIEGRASSQFDPSVTSDPPTLTGFATPYDPGQMEDSRSGVK